MAMPVKYFAPKVTVKLCIIDFVLLEITVVKIINNLNICSRFNRESMADVLSGCHVWRVSHYLLVPDPFYRLRERVSSLYILYKRLNVFEPIQFSIRMHQQPNVVGPVVLFHPHFLMILLNLFSF